MQVPNETSIIFINYNIKKENFASILNQDTNIINVLSEIFKTPVFIKGPHLNGMNFDDNTSFDIALSKVSKTGDLLPVRGRECSTQQTPFLNQKVKNH